MIRRFALFALMAVVTVAVMSVVSQAEPQSLLTRNVPEAVANGQAQFLSRLPANQSMRFDIVLALRHPADLQNFLHEVYDPTSPTYRHFVTVKEFADRFGPTQEDFKTVIGFAKANGFTVVNTTANRMDVVLTGSVANVEKAFHVTMGLYQHPTEKRPFYSPDRAPTVDLPLQLSHISGLDNYSLPHTLLSRRPEGLAKSEAQYGSGPDDSFLGSDMRAAYYGESVLTGAGQSLGLLEYLGTDLADLETYYNNVGQTEAVPITLYSTDGSPVTCYADEGCDDTEQTIDMTQALGMAPGMASLVMFVGSTDTALLNGMASYSPLPLNLSSSWYWGADPSTDDPILEEIASQGQTFFDAAGDGEDWQISGSIWPSDSAWVQGVGGTQVFTQSPAGPWASETTWQDGGGGISPNHIPIPDWQIATVEQCIDPCSTTYRDGPDVSGNAYWSYYVCADQEACTANEYGGTSFAAPMWAGYLALANQQNAQNGNAPLGFINPSLYTIGLGSNYDNDFHDITTGSNGYNATVGYDMATGWGTMNGAGLINSLSGPQGPSFGLSANPGTISIEQGTSGTSTITVTDYAGFTGNVTLTVTGVPNNVTAGVNPNPTAATSTLTVTAAPNSTPGTYLLTITGVSGSLTTQTYVQLQLAAAPLVTLSPTSLTFSKEVVGETSKAKNVLLENTGAAVLKLTSVVPSGDFAISANYCGTQVQVNESCLIEVTFTPTQTGTRTGALTLNDNAPNNPQTLPLSGTGEPDATLTPASATFAKTKVGNTSPAKTFTLANKQNVSLTGISISATGPFSVSSTTCSTSLGAKSSCTISVVFTPTQTGTATGTLQVNNNSYGSPETSSLSGTGEPE